MRLFALKKSLYPCSNSYSQKQTHYTPVMQIVAIVILSMTSNYGSMADRFR